MSLSRSQFGTRFGFLMAAAGAAVGLGNVWSFPSMAANNGGGAFLFIYIIMAFALAYPALMAELTLGRHSGRGPIDALGGLSESKATNFFGKAVGLFALFIATIALTFYSIVTGSLFIESIEPIIRPLNEGTFYGWMTNGSFSRDLLFASVALFASCLVVLTGVNEGIEKWSKRLMPLLIVTMLALIAIIATLPGASEGFKTFLIPDFEQVSPSLMLDAMGQAFFSMSIGIGVMIVFGSYLNKKENLPVIGAQVLLLDTGVAVIAGLMIIPAMFVASNLGVEIFNDAGELQNSASLLFAIMPSLFTELGGLGSVLKVMFFGLLFIAAITSMISGLEVSVSILEEKGLLDRKKAALAVTVLLLLTTALIINNFDQLFFLVIDLTINSMPISGALICFFAGWVLSRNKKLKELCEGNPEMAQTLFWKVWPWYVKFVCPVLPIVVFVRAL